MALVAPYFVDWTSYRTDFEREAGRILGRDVKVEGSASARLLPFPSVTFTDVVVAGVDPGEPAVTVETFSMDAELAPFMSGDIHIFDMRLVRPTVNIAVSEDGTVDWAVRPSVPFDASHISLEKVTVTEGKMSLRHAASGRTHELTEINADIAAAALIGPWRMDGSLRIDGQRTALSMTTGALDDRGALRIRLRAQPEQYPFTLETDGSARVEDGQARYAGQFRLNASTNADRLRTGDGGTVAVNDGTVQPTQPPAYRVSGTFAFDHLALALEQFRFETGSLEAPYTAEGSARIDLGAAPHFFVSADGSQFRFDDAAGEDAAGGASFGTRFAAFREFLLDLPRPAMPGQVEVALPAIVAGDTTIREVRLSASPSENGWDVASLSATLPGRTTLEADGALLVSDTIAFNGSLLLAVGQPSGFASWLSRDVDEAIRRLPAAGFSANVELDEQRQVFRDLELMLGAAKFRGEIDSRTPVGEHPAMTLTLDGDSLDIEGMAAFASMFVGEGGETRLADRDLEFDITAGPVSAFGLTAEKLDTALRLSGGRLEIDRLAIGGMAGANVSATGSVANLTSHPAGTIDASIISADLLPLAELVATRFPGNPAAAEVVRRATLYPGLLEEAFIDIVANANAGVGDATGLTLEASGIAGGTQLTASLRADNIATMLTQSRVSLNLSATNGDAAALYAAYGLPALPFGLAGEGRTELSFDGQVADGGDARLTFEGDGLSFGFDGTATGASNGFSASGAARLETEDLEPWLAIGGVSLPGFGLGLPVTLASQIDLDNQILVLSGLDGSIAGESVSGDLNAQMRDGLPHLTGALSISAFDLTMAAEMAVGADALAGDGESWPDRPFAPRGTAPFSADIEIATEELVAGTLGHATDARLAVRVAPDGISVSDLGADLYGGRLSGLVDFRNDGGTGIVSAQLQLRDAAATSVLGAVGIAGDLDLTASMTGSGKSVDALFASLAGSGTAAVRNLSIAGVDPEAFPALLAAADEVGPEIDAAATAGFAPTLIRSGILHGGDVEFAFTMANGTARVPPVRMDTEEAILSAELRADLRQGTVGADATLSYKPGLEELVGSEPAVRIAASGSLDDISVNIDTAPLAQFLTQRALELEQQRVEAMQAALLERQRLRRESRYYAALADRRRQAADEARRAADNQERLRREVQAQEAEAAKRAEEERLRLEAEEAERNRSQQEQDETATPPPPEDGAAARQDEADDRLRAEVEALLRARVPVDASRDATELPAEAPAQPTPRPAPSFRMDGATQPPADASPMGSTSGDGFLRMLFGDD